MTQHPVPQLEIVPHQGVGPVKLGMTRIQVREALAAYADTELDQLTSPTLDYAFGNSLQIEYDENGHAQFIGVGFYSECVGWLGTSCANQLSVPKRAKRNLPPDMSLTHALTEPSPLPFHETRFIMEPSEGNR